jgi:hypothetical protein
LIISSLTRISLVAMSTIVSTDHASEKLRLM